MLDIHGNDEKMISMDIPSHVVFLSWHNEMSLLPISAWRVGQGSRKRWWRRRCCERGRWCVWEARSSRRGAILQVRSSKHLLHSVINSLHMVWFLFHRVCALTCRQKEKEQMEALRKHHAEEIEHHKKEIERLQRDINRHQGKIRKLKHDD